MQCLLNFLPAFETNENRMVRIRLKRQEERSYLRNYLLLHHFILHPVSNMKSITTSIEINAPATKVRELFLDYKNHKNWNPFLVNFEKYTNKSKEELLVGDRLKIDMKPKGNSSPMSMYPTVLVNDEYEFKWLGVLWFNWLFSGAHSFKFDKIDGNTTKLVQSEIFGGILIPLFNWMGIFEQTEESFILLNEALKEQVELLD